MKLIDKSKLLDGLKKLKENLSASPIVVIEDVESLVESLEVKEVDLNKEIYNYLDIHDLNIQDGGRIVFKTNGDTPNFLFDFRDIAKHFYELGLKAQKGD